MASLTQYLQDYSSSEDGSDTSDREGTPRCPRLQLVSSSTVQALLSRASMNPHASMGMQLRFDDPTNMPRAYTVTDQVCQCLIEFLRRDPSDKGHHVGWSVHLKLFYGLEESLTLGSPRSNTRITITLHLLIFRYILYTAVRISQLVQMRSSINLALVILFVRYLQLIVHEKLELRRHSMISGTLVQNCEEFSLMAVLLHRLLLARCPN
jgi:hypothetical protein